MGLQYQAFKNCKKQMPAYKERSSNLEKWLSSFLNIIYQRLKYCHLFIKWGPSVKLVLTPLVFVMPFNFGYN